MSVYNAEQFLAQAIESILAQTYTDLEVILIDDGSTDGSAQMLAIYASKDARIRVVTQANTGLTKALNVGIVQATGTYICRMDADDIAKPERIARQVAYMDQHPAVAICGTLGEYIDEQGNVIGQKVLPTTSEAIKAKLLFNNQCIHSSLCIRKAVLDELGGYDEDFAKSQDYELLLRVGAKHKIANLPETLIQWRVGSGSISWSSKRQERDAIRARWKAITKYGYPKIRGFFHIILRFGWMIIPQRIKMRRYAQ